MHASASSEQACEPMASSSVKSHRKTCNAHSMITPFDHIKVAIGVVAILSPVHRHASRITKLPSVVRHYVQRHTVRTLTVRKLTTREDWPPARKSFKRVSGWTECAVPTGKRGEQPRGMTLVTHMEDSQASRRGNQMHPQGQHCVPKKTPYPVA
jgi:hypothetical protein